MTTAFPVWILVIAPVCALIASILAYVSNHRQVEKIKLLRAKRKKPSTNDFSIPAFLEGPRNGAVAQPLNEAYFSQPDHRGELSANRFVLVLDVKNLIDQVQSDTVRSLAQNLSRRASAGGGR